MDYLNKDSIEILQKSTDNYRNKDPFPHIIVDNFLKEEIAQKCSEDFELIKNGWIEYKHYNQNKRGNKDFINQNFLISSVTKFLNSDNFLKVLEDLTSYKEIISDPSLDGGGLHEIKNGGYLNIHTDFQNHTNYTNYKRKLNLLLFAN